jgi:hypothetical protein
MDPSKLLRIADEVGDPLIEGTKLRCPACENVADILAYTPMKVSMKYEDQVVVPLKCPEPNCRHIFALRPNGREEGI